MANAQWALQQAVYSALIGDLAVTSLLGGPHVYDDVPQGKDYPYLTFGQSSLRDWSTGSDDGAEHIFTLHVWSREAGRKQVYELMAALRTALHERALAMTGFALINLRHEFSDARREPDGDTYHGTVRFRAVSEPLV